MKKLIQNNRQVGIIHVFLLVLFLLGITTFGVVNLQSRIFKIKVAAERITPHALQEAKKGLLEYAQPFPDQPPRFYSKANELPNYNFYNYNKLNDLNDDRFIVSRPGQFPCPDNIGSTSPAHPGTGAVVNTIEAPHALRDVNDRNLDGVSDPGLSLCSNRPSNFSWFADGSQAGRYPYAEYADFISYIRGASTGDIQDGNRDRLFYVASNNLLDVSQAINPYHIYSAPVHRWLTVNIDYRFNPSTPANIGIAKLTNVAAAVISPGLFNSPQNTGTRVLESEIRSVNTRATTLNVVLANSYLEAENRDNDLDFESNVGVNSQPYSDRFLAINKDELLTSFDDFANVADLDYIADALFSYYKKNKHFPDPATFDRENADNIIRAHTRSSTSPREAAMSHLFYNSGYYQDVSNEVNLTIGGLDDFLGIRKNLNSTVALATRGGKVKYNFAPFVQTGNNVTYKNTRPPATQGGFNPRGPFATYRITGVVSDLDVGDVYLLESSIPPNVAVNSAAIVSENRIGFVAGSLGAELVDGEIRDLTSVETGKISKVEFQVVLPSGSLFRTARPFYVRQDLNNLPPNISIPSNFQKNIAFKRDNNGGFYTSGNDTINTVFPDMRMQRFDMLSRLGYSILVPAGSIIRSLSQVTIFGTNNQLANKTGNSFDGNFNNVSQCRSSRCPAREFAYRIKAAGGFSYGVVNDLAARETHDSSGNLISRNFVAGLAIPSETPLVPGHQGLLPTHVFPNQLPTVAYASLGKAQAVAGDYNDKTVPLGQVKQIQRNVDEVLVITDKQGAIGYFPGRVTLVPTRDEVDTYNYRASQPASLSIKIDTQDRRLPYYYAEPVALVKNVVKQAPRFAVIGPIVLAEGSKFIYGQGRVIPLGHAWSHTEPKRAFARKTRTTYTSLTQMDKEIPRTTVPDLHHPSKFHSGTIFLAPGSILTRVQLLNDYPFTPEDPDLIFADTYQGYSKGGPITIQNSGYLTYDQLLHYENGSSALLPLNPVQANFRIETEGAYILSTTNLFSSTYNIDTASNLSEANLNQLFRAGVLLSIEHRINKKVPYADGYHIYPFKNEYAVVSRRVAPVPTGIDKTGNYREHVRLINPIHPAWADVTALRNFASFNNVTTFIDNRSGRAMVKVLAVGQGRETGCTNISFRGRPVGVDLTYRPITGDLGLRDVWNYRYCDIMDLRREVNRHKLIDPSTHGSTSQGRRGHYALVDEFGYGIEHSGNLSQDQNIDYSSHNNNYSGPTDYSVFLDFDRGVNLQANPSRIFMTDVEVNNDDFAVALKQYELPLISTPLVAPFYPLIFDAYKHGPITFRGEPLTPGGTDTLIQQNVIPNAAEMAIKINGAFTLNHFIRGGDGSGTTHIDNTPSDSIKLGPQYYNSRKAYFEFKGDATAVESNTSITTFIPAGSMAEFGHLQMPVSPLTCNATVAGCESVYAPGGRIFTGSSGFYSIPRRALINSNKRLFSLPSNQALTLVLHYFRYKREPWVCNRGYDFNRTHGCPRASTTAREGLLHDAPANGFFTVTFHYANLAQLRPSSQVVNLGGNNVTLHWRPDQAAGRGASFFLSITLQNTRMVIPAGTDVGITEIQYHNGRILLDNDITFMGDGSIPGCGSPIHNQSQLDNCSKTNVSNVMLPIPRDLMDHMPCRNAYRQKFLGFYLAHARCYDMKDSGHMHVYIQVAENTNSGNNQNTSTYDWEGLENLSYTFFPYAGGKIAFEGGNKPFQNDNFWYARKYNSSFYHEYISREKVAPIDYILPNQILRWRLAADRRFSESDNQYEAMFNPMLQQVFELSWAGRRDNWNHTNFNPDSLVFAQNNPMFYAIAPSCRRDTVFNHEDCTLEENTGLNVEILAGQNIRIPEDQIVPGGLVIHGYRGKRQVPSSITAEYQNHGASTPTTLNVNGLLVQENGEIIILNADSTRLNFLGTGATPRRVGANDGVAVTIIPGPNGLQVRLASIGMADINIANTDPNQPPRGYLGRLTLIQAGFTNGKVNKAKYKKTIAQGDTFRIGPGSEIFFTGGSVGIQFGQVGSYSGPLPTSYGTIIAGRVTDVALTGRITVKSLSDSDIGGFRPANLGAFMHNFRTNTDKKVSFIYDRLAHDVETGNRFQLAYRRFEDRITVDFNPPITTNIASLPRSTTIDFNQTPGYAWHGYMIGTDIDTYAHLKLSTSTETHQLVSRTYNAMQPKLREAGSPIRPGIDFAMPAHFLQQNDNLVSIGNKVVQTTVTINVECLACGVYTVSGPLASRTRNIEVDVLPKTLEVTINHDGISYESTIAYASKTTLPFNFSWRETVGGIQQPYRFDADAIMTATVLKDGGANLVFATSFTVNEDSSAPFYSTVHLLDTPRVLPDQTVANPPAPTLTVFHEAQDGDENFYSSAHDVTKDTNVFIGAVNQAQIILENATPGIDDYEFVVGTARSTDIPGPFALVQSPYYAETRALDNLLFNDIDFEYTNANLEGAVQIETENIETYTYVPTPITSLTTYSPVPTITIVQTRFGRQITIILPTPTSTVVVNTPPSTDIITIQSNVDNIFPGAEPEFIQSAQYFFNKDLKLSIAASNDTKFGFFVPMPELTITLVGTPNVQTVLYGGALLLPSANPLSNSYYFNSDLLSIDVDTPITLGSKGAVAYAVGGGGAGRPIIFKKPSVSTVHYTQVATTQNETVIGTYDVIQDATNSTVQSFTNWSFAGSNVTTSVVFINEQTKKRGVNYRLADATAFENDRSTDYAENILPDDNAHFFTGINKIFLPASAKLTIQPHTRIPGNHGINNNDSDPFVFPSGTRVTFMVPNTVSNSELDSQDISEYKLYRTMPLIDTSQNVQERITIAGVGFDLEFENVERVFTRRISPTQTEQYTVTFGFELDDETPGSHPDPQILDQLVYQNLWIRVLDPISVALRGNSVTIIEANSVINPYYGTYLRPYGTSDNSLNNIRIDAAITAEALTEFSASPPAGILPQGITLATNRDFSFEKVKALISYSPRPIANAQCPIGGVFRPLNQFTENLDRENYPLGGALRPRYSIPDLVSNFSFDIQANGRRQTQQVSSHTADERLSVGDGDICMLNEFEENLDFDNDFKYTYGNFYDIDSALIRANNQMRLIGGQARF